MTTWFIVGHRAGARIFERDGDALRLISDIPNEAGRLKNQDIDSDRPGRSFDRGGQGRHAMGKEEEPHEQMAHIFARDLADTLKTGRNEHRYGRLVLVAEPKFLGMLKGALDAPTAALVTGTVTKDLARVSALDLPGHLKEVW